jgi:hypothetical protein
VAAAKLLRGEQRRVDDDAVHAQQEALDGGQEVEHVDLLERPRAEPGQRPVLAVDRTCAAA